MDRPEFFEPAEPELRSAEYAQAVRLGDRVEISGQGGWTGSHAYPPTVPAEYARAFDNVESVLRGAGASWDDVIAVQSFHVGPHEDVGPMMGAEFRRRMPSHTPIWTGVGVPMLGPDMHIEVRVTAVVGAGSSSPGTRSRSDVTPEFFVTPGYGEHQRDRLHCAQAVKVGNRIETSGQGGWSDDGEFPESRHDEVVRAFDNVERTLAAAGASWADVVSVSSFHLQLDDEEFASMSGQLRLRIPDHAPIWTCVGAARLGDPRMRVEIAVTAVVGEPG